MKMPLTSAANVFYLDSGRKFVNFASGTTNAFSVVNRANQTAIVQTTSGAQPTYSGNGIQGTYAWRNNPGTQGSIPPGQSALSFSGAQYLEYDALASQFSGTETAFAMVSLASCSTPSSGTNTIWAAAATGAATPLLSLHCTGGNLVLTETSSGGTTSITSATDTNPHVVSAIRTGTTLILRVDGVQVGTASIATPASQTYGTFTVGSQNSNGTNGSFFHGAIGQMLMFLGNADIDEVEAFLLVRMGLQRTNVFNS